MHSIDLSCSLTDAYMHVWINAHDVAKLAFTIPKHPGDPEQFIGFHLSLPMGYVERVPSFCATTETVVDMENMSTSTRHPTHLLENSDLMRSENKETHKLSG